MNTEERIAELELEVARLKLENIRLKARIESKEPKFLEILREGSKPKTNPWWEYPYHHPTIKELPFVYRVGDNPLHLSHPTVTMATN